MPLSQKAIEAAVYTYYNVHEEETTSEAMRAALTAALAVDGLVLVPASPSTDMIVNAMNAGVDHATEFCDRIKDKEHPDLAVKVALGDGRLYAKAYAAMIAAASNGEKE